MATLAMVIIIVSAWMVGAASHTEAPTSRPESLEVLSTEAEHLGGRPRVHCHQHAIQIIQRDLTRPTAHPDSDHDE